MTQDTERLRVLCDELRLALQRQRETNKRLVEALENVTRAAPELLRHLRSTRDPLSPPWTNITDQARAALDHASGGAS